MVPTTTDTRQIYGYFWLFGLINNVLYVVILSAAIDIVGPSVPKSVVLLADILPCLIVKVTAPFYIHRIRYAHRIILLILFSITGMVLVAIGNVGLSLFGAVLASFSSGLGEVTFLQLTHMFKKEALNGWSSGTGGAGLVGSFVYMLMTTILKVPITVSLLLFTLPPFGFLLYFKLGGFQYESVHDGEIESNDQTLEQRGKPNDFGSIDAQVLMNHFQDTLQKLRPLVIPYMLPLSTVYLFEYLINQTVAPTLLFPIDEASSGHFGFHKYRDIYVTYGTLYQIGVFISRSTGSIVRIRKLFFLSILQCLNFCILVVQSWNYIVKRPWPILTLVLYEGLIGGSTYVNTFLNILDDNYLNLTEFALGSVSMADSIGIFISALIGLKLEPTLCAHQVADGRPWCMME